MSDLSEKKWNKKNNRAGVFRSGTIFMYFSRVGIFRGNFL